MFDAQLDPPIIRMPSFGEGTWLNRPVSPDYYNHIRLIDFWDYTCINCIRTLPYLKAWHDRYAQHGLTIIGIHAPEFSFARQQGQVEAAINAFELPYPILLDNKYQTWERFATKAWPTKYLIDHKGYIRHTRRGEGGYQATEYLIQQLLRQRDPTVNLPDLLPPLRDEDQPGAVCYRPTPELHAGYRMGGLWGSAFGNPEGYVQEHPFLYTLPEAQNWETSRFYAAGFWRAGPECLIFAGQDDGQILLPYQAVGANVVLSPSSDPVELLLDIWPGGNRPVVEVKQNGHPLTPHIAGADIQFTADGHSYIEVTRPRLYHLVTNPDFGYYELELYFRATGLALYAFTFTTCLAPPSTTDTIHMP